jgi:hypothetical protein
VNEKSESNPRAYNMVQFMTEAAKERKTEFNNLFPKVS